MIISFHDVNGKKISHLDLSATTSAFKNLSAMTLISLGNESCRMCINGPSFLKNVAKLGEERQDAFQKMQLYTKFRILNKLPYLLVMLILFTRFIFVW